jgi:Family of unknown function (DUF5947)
LRSAFSGLRRFARSPAPKERCELCGLELAAEHRHLLETTTRQIVCACDACGLRFQDVVGGRFQLIPRETRVLTEFRMTDAQWDDLALPINLAFFFNSTTQGKMTALYPGPAGVTESLLRLSAWQAMVTENPVLAAMKPDVEALLVNRVGLKREYYLTPIDLCFELVGLIRQNWRGLSGGNEVWVKINQFFARLRGEPEAAPESGRGG